MAAEKTSITFVVHGREVTVDMDPSVPIGEAVRTALEKMGIDDGPVEWKARTAEGGILDSGKSLIEGGISGPARLYVGGGLGRSALAAAAAFAAAAGDTERRSMEFKESAPWKDLRCVLTRAIMAMANLKGGGTIIVGIKEGPGRTTEHVGMRREDFDTYNPDDIASFVNEYAEPSVSVVPHKIVSHGKRYVVLDVEEFDEVPIVCKKDGRKSCRNHLRRGSVYHRPRRKVESTDRFDYADMREPVSLAATKQHTLMHQQCAELYGMGGAVPIASRAPGAKSGRESEEL